MRIAISLNNIFDGRKRSLRECPLALAMRDAGFENPIAASVASGTKNGKRFVFSVPNDVRVFIERFDRGDHVVPFSFEVQPESI